MLQNSNKMIQNCTVFYKKFTFLYVITGNFFRKLKLYGDRRKHLKRFIISQKTIITLLRKW